MENGSKLGRPINICLFEIADIATALNQMIKMVSVIALYPIRARNGSCQLRADRFLDLQPSSSTSKSKIATLKLCGLIWDLIHICSYSLYLAGAWLFSNSRPCKASASKVAILKLRSTRIQPRNFLTISNVTCIWVYPQELGETRTLQITRYITRQASSWSQLPVVLLVDARHR